MSQGKGTKEWYLPQDFMRPYQGELFVGYEASARLSELGSKYKDLIESKRDGKYVARRIRWERSDIKDVINSLPMELSFVMLKNLKD